MGYQKFVATLSYLKSSTVWKKQELTIQLMFVNVNKQAIRKLVETEIL